MQTHSFWLKPKVSFSWGPHFSVYLWRRAESDCEREYSIDLGQFIFCCPRWVALGEIASLSPVIVASELKRSKKKRGEVGEESHLSNGDKSITTTKTSSVTQEHKDQTVLIGPKILYYAQDWYTMPRTHVCVGLCVCTCTCVKCIYMWG